MNSTLKNRLKNYSFWVSLASAILLLVQAIGKPLGLVINEEIYMSIVNSVLGVFVVLGIISHPAQNLLTNKDTQNFENDETVVVSDSSTQTQKITDTAVKTNLNNANTTQIYTYNEYDKTQNDILTPNTNVELPQNNGTENTQIGDNNETIKQVETSAQNNEIIVNGFKLQTKQHLETANNMQNIDIGQYETATNKQVFKNDEIILGGVEQDNKSNSTNS